ncbi:MAG: CoA-binding protein [Deltaproteobacteria bacterium SG8_13]|nr:MAG: CoA-binding protein [Deltaproteobacteria bacterium SG8_13]
MNYAPLFNPQTVAVVGVSLSNDRHPANVIYNKLHLRYPVKVYPVNPHGGMLHHDKVHRDISEIPVKIDLAVIAVRAEHVPGILESCIRSKVGGATIISGGFAESGRPDLQNRLVELAGASRFPFIGPNCLGIYVPNRFDTFFLPGERLIRPDPGNVAIVSQSGGVLVDQLVKFAEQGVGLSLAVSIGNKAQIREIDLLTYLAAESDTRVIAFYIEGFEKNEGRRFVQAATEISKPIVVLKAGKTAEGSRAASSHTASLAGDYRVFSEIAAQHGIIEARNEYEMVSFCESLSCYQKSITGKIGIITVSGGHGVLSTDACAEHGLQVPRLSEHWQKEIRNYLSPSVQPIASLANPIDLTGSAKDDDFIAAARALSQTPEIDCVIMLLLPYSPGITSDLGAQLSYVYQQEGKPLVAYVPHQEKYRMLIEGFELNNVPVAASIEGAVMMAEALRRCPVC